MDDGVEDPLRRAEVLRAAGRESPLVPLEPVPVVQSPAQDEAGAARTAGVLHRSRLHEVVGTQAEGIRRGPTQVVVRGARPQQDEVDGHRAAGAHRVDVGEAAGHLLVEAREGLRAHPVAVLAAPPLHRQLMDREELRQPVPRRVDLDRDARALCVARVLPHLGRVRVPQLLRRRRQLRDVVDEARGDTAGGRQHVVVQGEAHELRHRACGTRPRIERLPEEAGERGHVRGSPHERARIPVGRDEVDGPIAAVRRARNGPHDEHVQHGPAGLDAVQDGRDEPVAGVQLGLRERRVGVGQSHGRALPQVHPRGPLDGVAGLEHPEAAHRASPRGAR